MKRRTRSILEELSNLHRVDRTDEFVSTTGVNIIESAINLMSKIQSTYDEETAKDLERRFINSIRAQSSKKFKVGVDKIIESKK